MRFFKFPRIRNGATNDEVCRALNDISNHAEGFEREVIKSLAELSGKLYSLGDEVSKNREAIESLQASQSE